MANEAVDTPDDFTAAFSRISDAFEKPAGFEMPAEGAAPVVEPEVEKPAEGAAPVVEPEVEKPAEGAAPVVEPEVEKPADGAAPVVEPEVEKPAANDDELLARLASLVRKTPEPEVEKPAARQQEQEIYSAEDRETISAYEKDWPEVAKAEQIRRQGEYKQLLGYVFAEVAKELRPIVELTHELASRAAHADITSQVSDYDDVRDRVAAWVDQQPKYLQDAYKHVITSGTPSEVADLVGRYKRENNVAPKAPVPRKPEPELPDATKKAAASLAPVGSKRSAPNAGNPTDFESAFAAFDKTL